MTSPAHLSVTEKPKQKRKIQSIDFQTTSSDLRTPRHSIVSRHVIDSAHLAPACRKANGKSVVQMLADMLCEAVWERRQRGRVV